MRPCESWQSCVPPGMKPISPRCVRDLLLGREPKDYDVATSATPDVVLTMFPRTFAVGAHFGVVLVADETQDEPASSDGTEAQGELSTSPKLPLSAPMAPTPMAAIPMRCATQPAPSRMFAAAISPSTGCCSTHTGCSFRAKVSLI